MSIGKVLNISLFGESHGAYIGACVSNLPHGIKIDYDLIQEMLERRKAKKCGETARREKDDFDIISGVFNGYTTGAPLCVLIKNKDVDDTVYEKNKNIMRPSQVDYVSKVKYEGYADFRGGGHFSGRLSAPLVIIGAIIKSALKEQGVDLASHILKLGNVNDKAFSVQEEDVKNEIAYLNEGHDTLLDNENKIEEEIKKASLNNDSVGGLIECAVTGAGVGLGGSWFESLEGEIAKAMFAIGGVKGIEFGKGFGFSEGLGSELNDSYAYKGGKVITKTNNNGGINGGISNGMPIVFTLAIRPTSSISKEQDTIDIEKKENVKLSIEGRHDASIVRRISVVVDALLAYVIYDEYLFRKASLK